MKEIAYAKINLGLNILGKRNDGYHEVDMIMQSISLADEIEITEAKELMVTTNKSTLPGDKDNLAWKAAELLAKHLQKKPNVHISLTKNIFMAAGLAGGSSDAAAVLRGLNNFWQGNLRAEELEELSAQLGSDVPFCIKGGTVRARAKGEVLSPLPDFPEKWLVLAKPKNIDVPTVWVYKNYKDAAVTKRPNIDSLVKAIEEQKADDVINNMENVLETVTIPAHPIIAEIKEKMEELGAIKSLMSGSGPTVFGFVENKNMAEKIAAKLKAAKDLEIAVARTVRRREI